MDIVQEYSIGEFGGSYPSVPIANGVDLEALKALDADPFYVTLPIIPEVGAISKNGLLYDEALVGSVEEQINSKRPGGIFGHIKEVDRGSAFPIPEGMWVGAKREGNSLWAKCYIPPGAAREHLRRLKVMGGNIATSIYGKGDYEAVSKGVKRVKNFMLESLDFAPPERAALGYGARPILTAELDQENHSNMDKQQILAELTADDVPANVQEQIIRKAQAQSDNTRQVAELATQVADRDKMIAELQTGISEFRKAAFNSAVDAQVTAKTAWKVVGDEAKKKLEAFQRTFRSRLIAELDGSQDTDKVSEAANVAWADLEPLAETVRDALSGPPAVVSSKVRGTVPFVDTPEARAQARGGFTF
jgi:hypothetical protein